MLFPEKPKSPITPRLRCAIDADAIHVRGISLALRSETRAGFRTVAAVSWLVVEPTPSEKYAQVKIGNHVFSGIGVKILKIFELPPPGFGPV